MAGVIAIVGRPNVGKSALFNRLAGRRIAIVHDEPGVTRDRVSAEVEWHGHAFTLVDTGGLGLLRGEKAHDVVVAATVQQVNLAIEAATVVIFVVDVRDGVVPLDHEVAQRLRESGKPVLVAANKADTKQAALKAAEFAELGFDSVFPVSAIHGHGIDELMQAAVRLLPDSKSTNQTATAPAENPPLKIAIVGRPNVGKSSLINALIGSERVIVTPVPGTTRDAVDVPFEIEADGIRQRYILIDTAGIRRKRSIATPIEFFSVARAESAIERSDIAVLVLDAEAGIVQQDKKVAGLIVKHNKACVVAVNKWDLFNESTATAAKQRTQSSPSAASKKPVGLAEFGRWVQERLFFLDYAPVIFTSAVTRFNLDRLLEAIRYVAAQLQQKIPTGILNRTLHDAIDRRQPPSSRGYRLKLFYATQIKQAPPTFLLFVNRVELLTEQYKKYLASQLRRAFGYEGCPIVLVPRPRPRQTQQEKTS